MAKKASSKKSSKKATGTPGVRTKMLYSINLEKARELRDEYKDKKSIVASIFRAVCNARKEQMSYDDLFAALKEEHGASVKRVPMKLLRATKIVKATSERTESTAVKPEKDDKPAKKEKVAKQKQTKKAKRSKKSADDVVAEHEANRVETQDVDANVPM